MPLSEAASLRDRPSSTNAKASMRRTCAPSVHLPASTRNSALVWSAQVTFNVAPIDPPEANRLLRTSNQISPPWGIRPESQAQLRQSHWEISRKSLISRGETDGIPGFSEYVVPFTAVFSA